MRVRMCMVCGLDGYIFIDCLNRCGFCGDVIDICECVNFILVSGVMVLEILFEKECIKGRKWKVEINDG